MHQKRMCTSPLLQYNLLHTEVTVNKHYTAILHTAVQLVVFVVVVVVVVVVVSYCLVGRRNRILHTAVIYELAIFYL
jgi:hypothetical protein